MARKGWGRPLPEGFEEFLPNGRRRCWGRSRKDNTSQCRNTALRGQSVCRYHGGEAPQSLKKAAERTQEAALNEQANKLLVKLGADPCDNPLTALAERAGVELATWRSLAEEVNRLHGIDELRYTDAKGSEQIRSEAAMYERAATRLDALLTGIAKLNIDSRLVVIEEEKAKIFMDAVQAGLASIGVVGEQAEQAMVVMARKLHGLD